MSKQAKAIQKLIRSREGNDAYGSDDEKNPYASSVSVLYRYAASPLTIHISRMKRKRNPSFSLLQPLLSKSSNNRLNRVPKLRNLILSPVYLLQPLLKSLVHNQHRRAFHPVIAGIPLSQNGQPAPTSQNRRSRMEVCFHSKQMLCRVDQQVPSSLMASIATQRKFHSSGKLICQPALMDTLQQMPNLRNRRNGKRRFRDRQFLRQSSKLCCWSGLRRRQMRQQEIVSKTLHHIL